MKVTGFSRVLIEQRAAEIQTDLICPGCDADLTRPGALSVSVLCVDDNFRPSGHFLRTVDGARIVVTDDTGDVCVLGAGCSSCGEPDFDMMFPDVQA